MSVIALMSIRNIKDFGPGKLLELGCYCEDDMMAAYAEDEQDKLFTKYSPWGEMSLHQSNGWCLGKGGDYFYLMIVKEDELPSRERGEKPTFPGAVAYGQLRVVSITDFGDNMARTVEMCSNDWVKKEVQKTNWKCIDNFNWKMSVDNPPVFDQLKAGERDYWIAFYPKSQFDRNGAIAASHS